jgi:hypothetical protein
MKVRYLDLYNWENVTDFFSEEDRHYKNTYMEINEVYDGKIEVSLFSSKEGLYEIYFSYGILYGIIYVDAEKADSKREDIKIELAQEYQNHKEPTSEFINSFCEKHKVCMPSDILFDASALFDF